MAQLLTQIFNGKALSAASTQTLIEIMQHCRTGDARLRGRLPAGTVVANKTGTIGGSVNDVGVISLPDGAGKIVIAVFIKKSALPFEQRERVIAEIARTVRDYYLLAEPR
jgi:beta-lactamase class A